MFFSITFPPCFDKPGLSLPQKASPYCHREPLCYISLMKSLVPSSAHEDFVSGARMSIPVALGYFVVSFTFGVYAAKNAITPLTAALISFTNLSSTGQFVGIDTIAQAGSYIELSLAVILVNLRYALMSLSLTQHVEPGLPWYKRMLIAWAVTDEIFALAMTRRRISAAFYGGLAVLPVLAWTLGSLFGSLFGQVLSPSVQSAFGLALYAMFIAIVVPVAKDNGKIRLLVLITAAVSLFFHYIPPLCKLPSGWQLIIITLLVSALAATFLPDDFVETVPAEEEGLTASKQKNEEERNA